MDMLVDIVGGDDDKMPDPMAFPAEVHGTIYVAGFYG